MWADVFGNLAIGTTLLVGTLQKDTERGAPIAEIGQSWLMLTNLATMANLANVD